MQSYVILEPKELERHLEALFNIFYVNMSFITPAQDNYDALYAKWAGSFKTVFDDPRAV